MNSQALYTMSQIEIDKVDPSTLTDIDAIAINQKLTHEDKILSFIRQMGNPYCFISGGVPVRVRFAGNGKELSHSLVKYFTTLKHR